jgi:hypothetical protein
MGNVADGVQVAIEYGFPLLKAAFQIIQLRSNRDHRSFTQYEYRRTNRISLWEPALFSSCFSLFIRPQ